MKTEQQTFIADGFSHLGVVKYPNGQSVALNPPIQLVPGATYCVDVGPGVIRVWQLIAECRAPGEPVKKQADNGKAH